MLKLNFRDGTTLEFDLSKEDDFKQWNEWSSVKDFQERITGIGILHEKKFHTLPLPKGFKQVRFSAELVYKSKGDVKKQLGEQLVCHADNIMLTLMVYTYKNPPSPVLARVDMRRIGKQRGPYMN